MLEDLISQEIRLLNDVRTFVLTKEGMETMGLRGRSIFRDHGLVFFITTTIVHHDQIFGFGQQYYLLLIESLRFVISKYRLHFLHMYLCQVIYIWLLRCQKRRVFLILCATSRNILQQKLDSNWRRIIEPK